MAGCNQEWFDNLSAWHDGEVTDVDARRIEAHVADCPACRRAAEMLGCTRTALAGAASNEVPERLRARAATALAPRSPKRPWAWTALGAAAIASAAAAALFLALPHRGLPSAVEDELVSHHLAGFARERPCDFESSDPAAVAAWLQTELGYSVDVSVPPGARLLGARLCRIEGARTAALMFLREEKPLTVFVPPEGSDAARTARGFAGEGLRCTSGPLGKAICVKGVGRPSLVVAEIDPGALASTLQSAP
jgi:anti-sigma factor RsiW